MNLSINLNRICKDRRQLIGCWKLLVACSIVAAAAPPVVAPDALAVPGAAAEQGQKAFIPASPGKPIGDKWAVVIGISNFADPHVPALKYAAKDAKDFYAYLTDPSLGRFAKDHVKLLTDEQATKVNIMDMLGDSFLPHAAQPDDLVVIYLSTHGSPAGADIRGVNYVISYDTRLQRLFATGIEMKQLLRMIKERVHTNRIVLVLDTCYSGAGSEQHKGLSRTNVDAQGVAQGMGSLVICSSSPDQRSWESDQLRNSYFTAHLIDSLKSSTSITLDTAFNRMKQQVQTSVLKDKGELQTPVLSGSFNGPALVLATKPSIMRPAPVTYIQDDKEQASSGGTDFSRYGEYMRKARDLIESHKYWEASRELGRAIKTNPASIEAQLIACDVYDVQNRHAEALESAKHAVRIDDESARARQKLARAYHRLGQPDEALRQAQKALTLDPDDSSAHYLLGRINEKDFNRVDLSEQNYRRALALNSLNGPAWLGLARVMRRQGQADSAVEPIIRKAVEADEDDAEAQLELTRLLVRKGKFNEAERQIKKAIASDPNNALLHAEFGTVLADQSGKTGEAEVEFRKSLELGQEIGYCHYAFGCFLAQKANRAEEAERELRTAVRLDGEFDESRILLADLLCKKQVYDEADTLFRKAFSINPRNAMALIGIGNIRADLYRDYNGAEAEYKKALVLNPDSAVAHDLLGQLYDLRMSRYAEAQKQYEKAIACDPAFALPHYHMGMMTIKTMKEKDAAAPLTALQCFETAAKLDANNSLYLTKTGWIKCAYLKRYKEAETDFRKAVALNISDWEAHYRLGLLLIEKLGQRKAGEAELKTALSQNPADEAVKAACQRFVR